MQPRYLITSTPRSRSAWMAALLTAHNSPCLHAPCELPDRPTLEEVYASGVQGISDPFVSLVYRDQIAGALKGWPMLVIRRNLDDSRVALERFTGMALPGWGNVAQSLEWFEQTFDPMIINYEALDDPEMVDQVMRHLTGRPLDRTVFRIFNGLFVEQHKQKALAAYQQSEVN